MNDQYRGTIKQSFAWWDVGGADMPPGLFTQFNEKFKAWMLAKEAEKAAKKALKKGLKDPRANAKFAPEIVGMQFASGNNAQRKIKQYLLKNHLIVPPDYEFGVNKIDWGKYEITGSRKQIKK